MIALLFLFAFLQVADVVTTTKILNNGGKELNPIMNWLFIKFGMHNVLVIKAIVCICIGIMFYVHMPVILIPVCLVYVGVVGWNSYQIFKR